MNLDHIDLLADPDVDTWRDGNPPCPGWWMAEEEQASVNYWRTQTGNPDLQLFRHWDGWTWSTSYSVEGHRHEINGIHYISEDVGSFRWRPIRAPWDGGPRRGS